MPPDDKMPRRSIFNALRSTDEPEAPAAPPPMAPPAPPPPAPQPAPPPPAAAPAAADKSEERIAALERRLQETQKQAIEAMVRYSEREEAQKAAQREIEETLRGLASQRRGEEFDRQMREQLAAQRKRIEELEEKLLRTAKDDGGGARRDLRAAAEGLIARVEAAIERAEASAERRRALDELKAQFEERLASIERSMRGIILGRTLKPEKEA